MSLRIDNLTMKLKRQPILQDISAVFELGKITVLLGPNGAGKSTLLRCIAGLIEPTSGSITLQGQPLKNIAVKQRAKMIALLSQSAEIQWNITVRTLVALGRIPHHGWFANDSAADNAAIETAMTATDVAQFADRTIFTLSGGEKARVMLARVLAGTPQWLLADEPLAHLDLAHQLEVLQIFKDSARNGCGVVLVLHDLHQAARVADHIIFLSQGKIVCVGLPNKTLSTENIANIYNVSVSTAAQYTSQLNQ
jgi:iron complex transport system ATP-binding protein